MNNQIAIDSNIFIYGLDKDVSVKTKIALDIIFNNETYFSTHVLSEVINICNKRWKFNKQQLIQVSNF